MNIRQKLLDRAKAKTRDAETEARKGNYGIAASLISEATDLKWYADRWRSLMSKIKLFALWVGMVCMVIYFIALPLSHPMLTLSQLIIAYWPHYLVGAIIILLMSWRNDLFG